MSLCEALGATDMTVAQDVTARGQNLDLLITQKKNIKKKKKKKQKKKQVY